MKIFNNNLCQHSTSIQSWKEERGYEKYILTWKIRKTINQVDDKREMKMKEKQSVIFNEVAQWFSAQ